MATNMTRQTCLLQFRCTFSISDRDFPLRETIRVQRNGPNGVVVTFRKPFPDDITAPHNAEQPLAVADGFYSVRKRFDDVLQHLEVRQVPPDLNIRNDDKRMLLEDVLDQSGLIREKYFFPLHLLPPWFRDRTLQIGRDLSTSIRDVFDMTRWRCGVLGRRNALSSRGMQYSRDGIVWLPMPTTLTAHIRICSVPAITHNYVADIQHLLTMRPSEPLGHQLFREARELAGRTPRSALVIGIAALEAGMKECIRRLCPDTQWLLEESPSPPLEKMLRDYWHRLPTRKRINITPDIIDTVKHAVQQRNKIAHGLSVRVNDGHLEEVLLTINDLLWLFDYATGMEWAAAHMRAETLAKVTGKVRGAT